MLLTCVNATFSLPYLHIFAHSQIQAMISSKTSQTFYGQNIFGCLFEEEEKKGTESRSTMKLTVYNHSPLTLI